MFERWLCLLMLAVASASSAWAGGGDTVTQVYEHELPTNIP